MHLPVLTLKAQNTGSSLLRLTVCGLTLHYWLFIEIQLNEFKPVKVDKNANPVKKAPFNKPKHFYIILFFFI